MKIKIDCKTNIDAESLLNICSRSVDRERLTHRFLVNGDYHIVSIKNVKKIIKSK